MFNMIALTANVALALGAVVTFFLAFLNDGKVIVNVNHYGEAWFEAVLFPVIVVMGLVTLIRIWRSK